ncbi:MAG: PIN domain-containing protein [Candidatus Aminicenantes bacterium]|nr:PIN domain-containing protein [Candidatus Aminicenantes bacterium]NIM78843.1 PIN domain-containing protein [Candidatus Aminicenantes bacterium]NIN18099.1 PIN domain-containing protein [Candidatus Aminicenantes bacterium]NIN41998.1 PIN domain-containing protein [Candidatus Aminicenantes bacterium]NIN84754.1 PIN domain-containing protein [Candidatus Aminicenantes bacterium]
MKYLLDTHVFLWWIKDSPRLSQNIKDIIKNKKNTLFLSAASIWEMMVKSKLRKLDLPDNPKGFIKEHLNINAVDILNITMEHSFEIYNLPEIHKDPFDRMLVAQAKVDKLTILTSDPYIKQYPIKTYW